MQQTLRVIRLFFFALCLAGSWLVCYVVPEWDNHRWVALAIGACLGSLVILTDVLLKGFTLRGLTALSFGLFLGWLCAHLMTNSPFFTFPYDPENKFSLLLNQNMYLIRLAIFIVMMYLGAVLALRGKDDFNLIIPYVRFVPHGVDVPLVVVDTSALIDGRIVGICQHKFMGYALVIPRFVIDELQGIAGAKDPVRQARGRKGLDSLRKLREMKHLDLRLNDSSVDSRLKIEAKLVFLAQQLKARLLTTDFNLAQIAEFHNVEWLNLAALSKALNPEVLIGERVEIDVVKPGREPDQGVGYLADGSMVVISEGRTLIGKSVEVEIQSIVPSASGRIFFARMVA